MTKKEAAQRQINAAIEHFENKEYECAITLAGAAEGQVAAEAGSRPLFDQLRAQVPPEFESESEWTSWLNATKDWLKHETPQWGNEWDITEHAAALMIARAVTKFHWAYKQSTQRMENFLKLWHENEFYTQTKS